MSAFILPKGCVKSIEALCSRFLWSGKAEANYNAKVAWKEVCLPKEEGGLGLRRFGEWNKTLCLTLLWLLFRNSGSLWVRWHQHHNLNSRSLWEVERNPAKSWTWNKLLQLRPLALQFIRGKVGDGKRLSFWLDIWSPFGQLISFLGNNGPSLMRIQLSSTVEEACNRMIQNRRVQRSQNVNLLSAQMSLIRQSLSSSHRDEYYWTVNGKEHSTFPASQTWDVLRSRNVPLLWTKAVWFTGAIPRHAFNMWVASLNRLPTRSRIHSWDATISPTCVLCGLQDETREHLFLQCRFAKEIWKGIFSRLSPLQAQFQSWHDLTSWMRATSSMAPAKLRKLVGQAALYHVWGRRNDQLHTGQARTVQNTFSAMDKEIRNAILARRHRRKWRDDMILWIR